jgi:branched-chain amino acid transport system substrate-binding protein
VSPAARASRGLTPVLLAIIAALVLAGCGSRHDVAGDRIPGHALTIYTGLPLLGASASGATSVLDGERLALAQAHGRVGQYAVTLKVLNDATVARGGWDPGQVTQNAHLVLADSSAIAYIGDFNSGATAVAIPLLNRTGMLVTSPTSTAIGLTTRSLAASPGEPDKYYPTDRRTFVRLAADDTFQARAQVRLQRRLGCHSTYVLSDGGFDGHDAASSFAFAARAGGLPVAGTQAYDPGAQDYASLALAIAQTGANCVLLAAQPENHAAYLARQLGAALPHAKLFGTWPLAQPSFTDPDRGGIPAALNSRVFITAPAVEPTLSTAFDARFTPLFGEPGPFAAYGYEAMRVVLDAIGRATDGGRHQARRTSVLGEVMGSDVTGGPLGAFTVHTDGTTSLHSYGVFSVTGGNLVLWYVS